MARYSLSQLISRANAGNVGRRGLHRLEQAGLNPSELGSSGVSSPLNVDPNQELAQRRTALYANAVQSAHDLQPGQQLSAGIQRRLQLGAGGNTQFTPRTAQGVQGFGGAYDQLLAGLRKRAQGLSSKAGIYAGYR